MTSFFFFFLCFEELVDDGTLKRIDVFKYPLLGRTKLESIRVYIYHFQV